MTAGADAHQPPALGVGWESRVPLDTQQFAWCGGGWRAPCQQQRGRESWRPARVSEKPHRSPF